MIQKITKIICDNCGQGIYDFIGNSPRKYTAFAKQQGWIVTCTNGDRRDFCDEKCYQEWKNK